MGTSEHDRYSEDLGAYLLGALPDLEAEAVERHAMHCQACRDELARLRPAADALPHSVEQYEAPPSLKRSLMARVKADVQEAGKAPTARRERRRIRFLERFIPLRPGLALAGAVAVLAIGVGVGVAVDRLGGGEGGVSRTLAAQIDRRALPRAAAQLEVSAKGQATLKVQGVPVLHGSRVYEVWIERRGAVRPAGAVFAVTRAGSGAAALPQGVGGADRVLVTRERSGGVARPTEAPVISIRT